MKNLYFEERTEFLPNKNRISIAEYFVIRFCKEDKNFYVCFTFITLSVIELERARTVRKHFKRKEVNIISGLFY